MAGGPCLGGRRGRLCLWCGCGVAGALLAAGEWEWGGRCPNYFLAAYRVIVITHHLSSSLIILIRHRHPRDPRHNNTNTYC